MERHCQKSGKGWCKTRQPHSSKIWMAHGLQQAYHNRPHFSNLFLSPSRSPTQQGQRDSLHLTCSLQHGHLANEQCQFAPLPRLTLPLPTILICYAKQTSFSIGPQKDSPDHMVIMGLFWPPPPSAKRQWQHPPGTHLWGFPRK